VAIVLSSGLKHGACSSVDVVVIWPLFCRLESSSGACSSVDVVVMWPLFCRQVLSMALAPLQT
jgi:hypothetical protein